jgi:hypothetical protein
VLKERHTIAGKKFVALVGINELHALSILAAWASVTGAAHGNIIPRIVK